MLNHSGRLGLSVWVNKVTASRLLRGAHLCPVGGCPVVLDTGPSSCGRTHCVRQVLSLETSRLTRERCGSARAMSPARPPPPPPGPAQGCQHPRETLLLCSKGVRMVHRNCFSGQGSGPLFSVIPTCPRLCGGSSALLPCSFAHTLVTTGTYARVA